MSTSEKNLKCEPTDEYECDEIECANICNNSADCSWFLYGKKDDNQNCFFFKNNNYGVASIRSNPKKAKNFQKLTAHKKQSLTEQQFNTG